MDTWKFHIGDTVFVVPFDDIEAIEVGSCSYSEKSNGYYYSISEDTINRLSQRQSGYTIISVEDNPTYGNVYKIKGIDNGRDTGWFFTEEMLISAEEKKELGMELEFDVDFSEFEEFINLIM